MRTHVVSAALGLSVWLISAACGSDANDSSNRDGGPKTDGGTNTAYTMKCSTATPCATDTQCVSIAGSSCNTRTNKCQTVLCGGEGETCSVDSHCQKGFICDNGGCKYDPAPRCYHASDKVCVQGDDSYNWMKDCVDEGGEVVSSCPAGRVAICRYMDGDREISIWIYRQSDVATLQQGCAALQGKISYGAN